MIDIWGVGHYFKTKAIYDHANVPIPTWTKFITLCGLEYAFNPTAFQDNKDNILACWECSTIRSLLELDLNGRNFY